MTHYIIEWIPFSAYIYTVAQASTHYIADYIAIATSSPEFVISPAIVMANI